MASSAGTSLLLRFATAEHDHINEVARKASCCSTQMSAAQRPHNTQRAAPTLRERGGTAATSAHPHAQRAQSLCRLPNDGSLTLDRHS
jgi:hypothetical protein